MKQESAKYVGLFSRLLTPFQTAHSDQEAGDGAAVQEAYESVTQLNALVAEMARLRGLRTSEASREAELDAELSEIELQRIEALTEFKVSGDQVAKKRADVLLKNAESISQQKSDCQSVAKSIQARVDALELDKKNLRIAYQRDLGMFLDQVFARMCQHYTTLVPEVAEAAMQIAAVQKVMMRYLCGNSNGFERRIYLPTAQPGNGKTLAPLLDTANHHFEAEVNARMDAVLDELRQAGFTWRFD